MCKYFIFYLFLNFTSYTETKNLVAVKRKELLKTYHAATNKPENLKNVGDTFATLLHDNIINHWYGTKWTFEGHTDTPKKGSIACGYFVSTTLKDMGLQINRYKLAQKAPLEEAKTLSCGETILTLENKTPLELYMHFNKQKDGMYFLGMDYHVGFVYKKNKEIHFIHSNYINKKGVCKETITASKAIFSSKYYIVNVSNNTALIKKWLLQETIST
jgi:hypothetical protein